MFCRKCGKTIPDDSKFCPYCGETVELIEAKKEDTPSEIGETPCTEGLSPDTGSVLPDEINNNTSIEPTPNEDYPYGACSKCGEPLEADDNLICKKCVAEENQRKNLEGFINCKAPKHKNKKSGGIAAIVFLSVCAIILIIIIANYKEAVPSTASNFSGSLSSDSIASSEQESLSSTSSAPSASSSNDTASEDITDIKTQAEETAIAWADENMEQYGKISDRHFSGGIYEGDFYAELKFRSPNVYGANEQHDLIMKYKKGSTGWEISGIDFDGQVVSDDSEATG